VKHKEIDPLGDNLISLDSNKLLKKPHLIGLEWHTPGNACVAYFVDCPIDQDDLGAGLTTLKLSVNVNRFVFVGIEHHDQTEVFIQLGMAFIWSRRRG